MANPLFRGVATTFSNGTTSLSVNTPAIVEDDLLVLFILVADGVQPTPLGYNWNLEYNLAVSGVNGAPDMELFVYSGVGTTLPQQVDVTFPSTTHCITYMMSYSNASFYGVTPGGSGPNPFGGPMDPPLPTVPATSNSFYQIPYCGVTVGNISQEPPGYDVFQDPPPVADPSGSEAISLSLTQDLFSTADDPGTFNAVFEETYLVGTAVILSADDVGGPPTAVITIDHGLTPEGDMIASPVGLADLDSDISGESDGTASPVGQAEPDHGLDVDSDGSATTEIVASGSSELQFNTDIDACPVADADIDSELGFDTGGSVGSTSVITGSSELTGGSDGQADPVIEVTGDSQPSFDSSGSAGSTSAITGSSELSYGSDGQADPVAEASGGSELGFSSGSTSSLNAIAGGSELAFDSSGEGESVGSAAGSSELTGGSDGFASTVGSGDTLVVDGSSGLDFDGGGESSFPPVDHMQPEEDCGCCADEDPDPPPCCDPYCSIYLAWDEETSETIIYWWAGTCLSGTGPPVLLGRGPVCDPGIDGCQLVTVRVDGIEIVTAVQADDVWSDSGEIRIPSRFTRDRICMQVTNACGKTTECCYDVPCCIHVTEHFAEIEDLQGTYYQKCTYSDRENEFWIRGMSAANGSYSGDTVPVGPPTFCCPVEPEQRDILVGTGEIEFRGRIFEGFEIECFNEFGQRFTYDVPGLRSYSKFSGNIYVRLQGGGAGCMPWVYMMPTEYEAVSRRSIELDSDQNCALVLGDCPNTDGQLVGLWPEDNLYCLYRYAVGEGPFNWDDPISLTDIPESVGYGQCGPYAECEVELECLLPVQMKTEFFPGNGTFPIQILCAYNGNLGAPLNCTVIGNNGEQCYVGYGNATVWHD